MKLPKSLTTVTPLSKSIALMMIVILPFIGFYLGAMYQKSVQPEQIGDNQGDQISNLQKKSTAYINAQPTLSTIAVQPSEYPNLYNSQYVAFEVPANNGVARGVFTESPNYKDALDVVSVEDPINNQKITITTSFNYPKVSTETALGKGPMLSYDTSSIAANTISEIEVGGYPAVMAQNVPAGVSGVKADVLILHDDKITQIVLEPGDADLSGLQRMLYSFKFR